MWVMISLRGEGEVVPASWRWESAFICVQWWLKPREFVQLADSGQLEHSQERCGGNSDGARVVPTRSLPPDNTITQ